MVEIRHVRDHYEGYINGEFVCSGDTYGEVYRDLEELS